MNAVDGSEHYERTSNEPPPSLLTIIIDTNPVAWAVLSETLTLSQAVANLLVFINAHLAFNNANKVAVIASHVQRAEFLYPPPIQAPIVSAVNGTSHTEALPDDSDTDMADVPIPPSTSIHQKLILNGPAPLNTNGAHAPFLTRSNTTLANDDANIYRPFHQISTALLSSLSTLLATTTASSLTTTSTTALAGALTLALTYINKQTTLLTTPASSTGATSSSLNTAAATLTSRILVVSVSTASPSQYIPFMNTIFAAQRLQIPIDVLALAGLSSFLQQAADATNGTYISLCSAASSSRTTTVSTTPATHGLLPTLLLAFLPDRTSRSHLIAPTEASVDFRAACFCHRKVVDIGFVCSICLSIFCEPPEGAVCLTCGTHLRLGKYGGQPAVVVRKKKRRRKDGEGRDTPARQYLQREDR